MICIKRINKTYLRCNKRGTETRSSRICFSYLGLNYLKRNGSFTNDARKNTIRQVHSSFSELQSVTLSLIIITLSYLHMSGNNFSR